MGFGDKYYNLRVTDGQILGGADGSADLTSGCLVFVYTAGTKTLATIYGDAQRTAKTNAITRSAFATDGGIKFYGAASSYDIVVNHSDGSIGIFNGVTPEKHTLVLDRTTTNKVLIFPMVFNSGGTETDTGLDLPLGAKVEDVLLEVTTTDATETVAIGLLSSETAGDADGFLEATSVAASGFVKPFSYFQGTYYYVDRTAYGALFGKGQVGNDAAGSSYGVPKQGYHIVQSGNAVSVSYTPSTSDTFAGYGYLYFSTVR